MKKLLSILTILLMLFCLTGCGGENKGYPADVLSPEYNGPMIITTSWISVETKNFSKAKLQLRNIVKEYGGYFTNSEEEADYDNETGRNDGNMTGKWLIRIPSDKFNSFAEDIGSSMTVVEKSVSNEDVTALYFEIESGMNIIECNTIVNELKDIKNKVAYSTINLTIKETKEATVLRTDSFFEKMYYQFLNGFDNLLNILETIMFWAAYNFVGLIILTIWTIVVKVTAKAGFGVGTPVNLILIYMYIPILWAMEIGWIGVIFALVMTIIFLLGRVKKDPKVVKKNTNEETK